MIKITKSKVKDALVAMHEALQRKVKRGSKVKEDIIVENHIFAILCTDYNLEPMKIANAMNEKYGCELTGDEVIQIFRNRRMANPNERKELLEWAGNTAEQFSVARQIPCSQ